MEGVGRLYDLHMAEKYPRGTERRPCTFPITQLHGVQFEYDPTPLQPGEHHVVERTQPIREALRLPESGIDIVTRRCDECSKAAGYEVRHLVDKQ